ncbi:histidine--tRNA ligase [soil metagenome]
MSDEAAAQPPPESVKGARKPQILKGFRDYLPDQMRLRQEVIARFRTVFEAHGFEPLDTPAIEYLEVLTGKAGENEKLMYEFEDHGGRQVGLRYDLTVPLARVVAMHQSELVLPFKRYHIAPVWRAEKPQRGRFREFWQCDADIAGAPSALADAEVIAILGESLTAVDLPAFSMLISHRALLARLAVWAGVPEELAGQVYRSVDKLAKIGQHAVIEEMTGAGIKAAHAERILNAIMDTGDSSGMLHELRQRLGGDGAAMHAIGELEEIFAVLPAMGIPEGQARFDPTLARGLDYYTGPVFEATVDEPKVGSVAGGGRYEHLIGSFMNRTISATGVSLGMERILEVLNEYNTLPISAAAADVLVVTFADSVPASARIARQLRSSGLRAELASQSQRSVGEQLKYASRKNIPFAVIAGQAEIEKNEVRLKNLETGEQISLSLGEAVARIGSGKAESEASS